MITDEIDARLGPALDVCEELGIRAVELRTVDGVSIVDHTPDGVRAHDLGHRRISFLHLGGVPWARIGEHVGQRNLADGEHVHARPERRGRARLCGISLVSSRDDLGREDQREGPADAGALPSRCSIELGD